MTCYKQIEGHFNFEKIYSDEVIKAGIGDNFLEIGAGIGSFTDGYKNKIKNIFLTEIEEENLNI